MPKFTALGVEQETKQRIVLTHFLSDQGQMEERATNEYNFDNYELICKAYTSEKLDMIFAYDNIRENGCLYFGHWNDGFI